MFFMNLILCGIMAVVGRIAGRTEDPKTCAMYILCMAGLNVGSFSIPFIQTFFPEQMMSVVMFDIGNAISCCGPSFSFAVMQRHNTRGVDLKLMGKTLTRSFAFVLYVVLLLLQAFHVRFPEPVYEIAGTIGAANPVVVMLMLGILFEVKLTPKARRQVFEIVAIRVATGAVLALLAWLFLPLPLVQRQVLVLLLFCPITSMATVFCGKMDCDPDVYGTATSLTIPISVAVMVGLGALWAA
jgi:predicted permease